MKRAFMIYGCLAVMIILLSGCGSMKVHYLTENRYKATRSAEILQREPERPYIMIAILEGRSPKFRDGAFVFEKLRNKARRIGAHAIMPFEYFATPDTPVVSERPQPQGIGRNGRGSRPDLFDLPKQPREWGKAYAIRYTDTD